MSIQACQCINTAILSSLLHDGERLAYFTEEVDEASRIAELIGDLRGKCIQRAVRNDGKRIDLDYELFGKTWRMAICDTSLRVGQFPGRISKS